MLPAKWVAALVFIYVMAMIAGSITLSSSMFANENVTNPMQVVSSYGVALAHGDFLTVANPIAAPSFFSALFQILILDFPVFNSGPWIVLRWIILGPIIALVVYGVVSAFFQLFQRNV